MREIDRRLTYIKGHKDYTVVGAQELLLITL